MQKVSIPVTIISGFLGAGKTTLLNYILKDPQGVRYGVLINDFGAINIDAELVVESAADQVTLENGCVCCTIRDDFIESLTALLDRSPPPESIIVEASGVSRPLSIADALDFEGIAGRVTLDGIFCLVDGAGFGDLDFAATELALDQAAGADVIVVNKVDIATSQQIDAIERTLTGPLPLARIVRTTNAQISRDLLFEPNHDGDAVRLRPRLQECASHDRMGPHEVRDCGNHHNDHDHDDEFEAWHWTSDLPVDLSRLRAAVRKLPTAVIRAKGILRSADDVGARIVFHLVGKRSQVIIQDQSPPGASSVVAIGRRGSFDLTTLSELFDSCVVQR